MRAVFRRGALIAWWTGQGTCGLCWLGAVAVLIQTNFATDGQICAAGLLLAGILALIGGRVALRLGSRRVRRRAEVY